MNRKEASFILANIDRRVCDDELNEALDVAIKALEQEPCDDEYIKVPKKALKYRTKGMVAYNAEWLKNHFDIERAVICGAQQPCEDTISRQAAQAKIKSICDEYRLSYEDGERKAATGGSAYALGHAFDDLPLVTPQPEIGCWIDDNENEIDAQYGRHLYKCSECNEYADMFVGGTEDWWDLEKPNYCPNCGARMIEEQESEERK